MPKFKINSAGQMIVGNDTVDTHYQAYLQPNQRDTITTMNPDVLYIQNTNITGTLDESHDVIRVGNHVTTAIATGDVTTSNANITLRAREILLDSGTHISAGSTLKAVNP